MCRRFFAAGLAILLICCTACSNSSEPDLASVANPAAASQKLTGADGPTFLREISTYEWSDDGKRAAASLAWIPADATSADPTVAQRAGRTAHAIAEFLAGDWQGTKAASAENPALFEAYAKALIPYQAALVGGSTGTAGFAPLESPDGKMPKTAQLFAAMSGRPAGRSFIEAAASRATSYEEQFANYAAANPTLPHTEPGQEELLLAARLRGLISAGTRLAGEQTVPPTETSLYELQFMVVSRMVRGRDPRISPEFFNPDGSLRSADQIDGGSWSRYNAELASVLAPFPRLTEAIETFGETAQAIA